MEQYKKIKINSDKIRGDVDCLSNNLFFENKIVRDSADSLENVRWLTTGEAAQYLRISISSIKTMIYRGQVRVHKLGRRNRYRRDELERLITLSNL